MTRSPAVDAASGRRHQPVRQARTNPHRGAQGNGSRRDSVGGPASGGQPIDIFPGVTHFADAIAALPKELVRHLTLLKEVDAKSSAPEQQLQDLVQACLDSPLPQPKTDADAASASSPGTATPRSTAMGAPTTTSTLAPNPARSIPASDEGYQSSIYDQGNTPRRQLFHSTAAQIKNMLMSLDEKNHVICTANEVLDRQISRVEDIWPHLEAEFSEEAKWGSTTHWAYPENRTGKPAVNERSRRDAQPTAAQQAAEEAAARSDARKQAVQAKKNQRSQAQDDAEGGKRPHGGKNRKTAENPGAVGLGITGGAANGAANPPPKRRKVEKPVNGGGAPSERAMSSVFGNVTKGKATTSPRATPVPEGQKKRKALPSGPTQNKKRLVGPHKSFLSMHAHILTTARSSRNGAASATSSPVLGALPDGKNSARNSPAPPPTSTPKLGPSRSKPTTSQPPEAAPNTNGTNSASSNGSKARPPSPASNKANGTAPETPDPAAPSNGPRQASEPKPAEEQVNTEAQRSATPVAAAKETNEDQIMGEPDKVMETPKPEEADKKAEPRPAPAPISTPGPAAAAPIPPAATPATVTTKSGRASKPSTPALATFQEAAAARPRSSRDSKRSHHKKSASQSTISAPARPAAPASGGADGNGAAEDEEVDADADELTYCYCNSVSYGAMVACDSDECAREWFHLECVGLK
ncbi:MAG: hypothetical protein IMZ44_21490, partial [Planctomycetes bacterium]|nr:hypothetical protein [Planctomycetota bacterium]